MVPEAHEVFQQSRLIYRVISLEEKIRKLEETVVYDKKRINILREGLSILKGYCHEIDKDNQKIYAQQLESRTKINQIKKKQNRFSITLAETIRVIIKFEQRMYLLSKGHDKNMKYVLKKLNKLFLA